MDGVLDALTPVVVDVLQWKKTLNFFKRFQFKWRYLVSIFFYFFGEIDKSLKNEILDICKSLKNVEFGLDFSHGQSSVYWHHINCFYLFIIAACL